MQFAPLCALCTSACSMSYSSQRWRQQQLLLAAPLTRMAPGRCACCGVPACPLAAVLAADSEGLVAHNNNNNNNSSGPFAPKLLKLPVGWVMEALPG